MSGRSIGVPVTLGVSLAVIALALGIGWLMLVVSDLAPPTGALEPVHWFLIVLGTVFFLLIIAGLVALCVWVAREIRVNQRQQAFLDAVTHEMKTPLASLSLYLETLQRRDPGPEKRSQFLHKMGMDVERLEHTMDQVLAAARAEDRRRPAPEPVDMVGLLNSLVAELRERHGLAADAIQLRSETVAAALGNPAELAVVFRNLLENAVKYSESPVQVDVDVAVTLGSDGRLRVAIEDRGIGIEPGELNQIFQRFYRVGRGMQRQAAGLGLGLYIVWSLVRRNGGRVMAQSTGAGEGSRFVVTLRVAPEPMLVGAVAGSAT